MILQIGGFLVAFVGVGGLMIATPMTYLFFSVYDEWKKPNPWLVYILPVKHHLPSFHTLSFPQQPFPTIPLNSAEVCINGTTLYFLIPIL